MTHDTITRTDSSSNEKSTKVFKHGPKKNSRRMVLFALLAVLAVFSLILGFVVGSIVTGGDDSGSDDGSNVSVNEEPKEREASKDGQIDASDHESLLTASEGRTLTGLDISFSGDPSDLYLVATAGERGEYSITTHSVDKNGERISNEFGDLTDSLTILTPEQTGLHIEDGVTALADSDPSINSETRCELLKFNPASSPYDDPGCAYVVTYERDGDNDGANYEESEEIRLLGVDGTGEVVFTRELAEVGQKMFPVVEGGEITVE